MIERSSTCDIIASYDTNTEAAQVYEAMMEALVDVANKIAYEKG